MEAVRAAQRVQWTQSDSDLVPCASGKWVEIQKRSLIGNDRVEGVEYLISRHKEGDVVAGEEAFQDRQFRLAGSHMPTFWALTESFQTVQTNSIGD